MYKHNCIKCRASYEDNEYDNYYCPACLILKNEIAKAIDAKFSTVSTEKIPSELELFEREGKTFVDQHGVKRTFAKA